MPALDALARLACWAEQRGGSLALDDGFDELTFRQLAARVGGLAQEVEPLDEVVGVLLPGGASFVIADLALSFAGKTFVPLPPFFSAQQLAHIARDSGMGAVLTTPGWSDKAEKFGLPVHDITPAVAKLDISKAKAGGRIIYTSGSTGAPKGVKLGTDQLNASAQGLLAASGGNAQDRYLSVLPQALLLEQVAGIHVPLLAGAPVFMATGAAQAAASGDFVPLVARAKHVQPTVTVLVPELLRAWVAGLGVTKSVAPSSLRFVAVGGAPVPQALCRSAMAHGIPVHEGYGLSECCSVVSVNRPGQSLVGTAGQPLDGVKVTIENGEIVVEGPTVMAGYLNGPEGAGRFATGDLGSFDADGNLIVHGRKDNLIVLSSGRNINPEWIEGMILADPLIARAVVVGHGQSHPTAVLTPSSFGLDWFATASRDDIERRLAGLTADAPDYAQPSQALVVGESVLVEKGLLTGNGRVRRQAIESMVLS
ncbi:MAG: AMP-binding protein [Alphaproteobacteria bacterium]|nr:AMP-binding protein [Alphaproteobacteria bacterium]